MRTIRKQFLILGLLSYITQIITVMAADEIDTAEIKCRREYNVDDSAFVNEGKGDDLTLKDESNENHKCYMKCASEAIGIAKDDKFEEHLILKLLQIKIKDEGKKPVEEKELKASVTLCVAKTGNGICDKFYQVLKCIGKILEKQ